MSFSSLGTKIFTFMNQRCSLIYDTKTAAMTIGAHAPADMVCGFGITVVVDEMLYALSYHFRVKQHSFGVMSWGSTAPDALQQPTEGWSWKTLPPPPPTFHRRVNSYALHPDGCTIFMSTANFMTAPSKGCMGTYSFNTKDSVWRWHGEWALPFTGQAHFDRELNAWVGLGWDGYISACQVASPSCHSTTPTQDWASTQELNFNFGGKLGVEHASHLVERADPMMGSAEVKCELKKMGTQLKQLIDLKQQANMMAGAFD
uniref:Uncharacterized protein n=1 Tax=Aegilops tauschii TaxID=37682 RepID=M8C1P3_AEGTA